MSWRVLFGARAQVVIGAVLFVAACIGWPATALTVFRHEQQGILGLSWGAMILAGYNIMATGLGYRKTEHVEAEVIETISHADEVIEHDGRRVHDGA
jgi:purine-cytosine permease-like protein